MEHADLHTSLNLSFTTLQRVLTADLALSPLEPYSRSSMFTHTPNTSHSPHRLSPAARQRGFCLGDWCSSGDSSHRCDKIGSKSSIWSVLCVAFRASQPCAPRLRGHHSHCALPYLQEGSACSDPVLLCIRRGLLNVSNTSVPVSAI